MKRALLIISCLLAVAASFGCARTVTNVNFGATMSVTVTLRGNADILKNRYFLVLAGNPTLKVPLPLAENPNQYEFLEPDGTLPKDTAQSLTDYYTNYFSTWGGYIMLDSTGQYFYAAGPFTQGVVPARTPFAVFGGGSNKLTFNFQMSRVFPSGVPATAYFDVISVPWPAADRKIAADHINSTNAYVSTLSGSTFTIVDPFDTGAIADPALDILTCEVTVQ